MKKINHIDKRAARHPHTQPDLPDDYFRFRDFEYVQPLYDLAFLLEVDALAKGTDIPQYRTFSLWRAAYSLDGYATTIDRWLEGVTTAQELDYVPSARIRQYLEKIRLWGSLPELRAYRSERFERTLRLRSVRGLGPSKIATTVSSRSLADEWFSQAAINLTLNRDRITELYYGLKRGPWQTAHVVPPLLRLLNQIGRLHDKSLSWHIHGIGDPYSPISESIVVQTEADRDQLDQTVTAVLKHDRFFRRTAQSEHDGIDLRHQMGWTFSFHTKRPGEPGLSVSQLAHALDPLADQSLNGLLSDLHLHTAWSDGNASVNTMAIAIVASHLKFFAVTDHSRSSKLQGGLTPILWLRQANALTLAAPVCPVLHGIEVDILKDGSLDLPQSLLNACDLVVASVHSSWTDDPRVNTDRLLRAIESGSVDILAHATSAITGKPGVPDYLRMPATIYWDEVFERCVRWHVALELNCFPSRLDLPLDLLNRAIELGCAVSLGSDAHSRSHLLNLRFGARALRSLKPGLILNRLTFAELTGWVRQSRAARENLTKKKQWSRQTEFPFEKHLGARSPRLTARIQLPQNVPAGSRVIGIDLTAGDKLSGIALLDGFSVQTCSLSSDREILEYIASQEPAIVSIDSPLGLPGGGDSIDPKAGIVRVAEQDLASIGISAYPALIDSMKNLTLRGIRLRAAIRSLPTAPAVIESYPGAAQDILCIPRKQKSLALLREGLQRLGLTGPGLLTKSHDEMDAVTSAIVARYFESGRFEAMGIEKEAQLIVPKVRPLDFSDSPIICLAGKTGAGKSVVARYLSAFYGFEWVRTRDAIRQLLKEDADSPPSQRMFNKGFNKNAISETDLQEFGAIVLNRYHQAPLREKLTFLVSACHAPIVVDSIRDTVDLDTTALAGRPVIIWFLDCHDSLIQRRLATRTKFGASNVRMPSPVDLKAANIRREAHEIIPNNGSLEELRWRVDDTLFEAISIANGQTEAPLVTVPSILSDHRNNG